MGDSDKPCADGHPSHITFFPQSTVATESDAAPPGAVRTIPKGMPMDVRFLRDEAARFRGMAEDADREASRIRFLAMAEDYDARAKAAGGTLPTIEEDAVEPRAEDQQTPVADASLGGTLSIKPVRSRKETVMVERRPVGRPRRE